MNDESWAESLVDGHRVLPVLLDDLRSATKAIHLSMFLFFDDPIGEEIERVLEKKARVGVPVRVLLNVEKTRMGDPFSTGEERMMREDPDFHRNPTDISRMEKRLRAAGVVVLDTNIDYDRIVETGERGLDALAKSIRDAIEVDDTHIDHRKIITIDGRVAYCGSANIGAQYLHHHRFDPTREAHEEARMAKKRAWPEPWWKWHDGLVRFEGSIVRALDVVFRERWLLGGGERFVPCEVVPPGTLAPPRGVRLRAARIHKNEPSTLPNEVRALFLRRIGEARERIVIENPYVYHPAIIDALVAARRRSPAPEVTLVVPAMKWNDNEFAQDAMQHHYPALLEAGVAVFEYQNHFTHLKLATFDGHASIVGSANLNLRSLEDDKDFECVVEVEGDELARQIEAQILADLPVSKRIERADVERRTLRALRMRVRDPRTLLMLAAREL